jgi:hypothetical protein
MPERTQAQYNKKTPALSFKRGWSNEKVRGMGERKKRKRLSLPGELINHG